MTNPKPTIVKIVDLIIEEKEPPQEPEYEMLEKHVIAGKKRG